MRSLPLESPVTAGRARIAICNWRDLRHPEGGGSELYVERMAKGLAAAGNHVTLLSAAVAGQPRDELRDGIHYRRRGGRYTVYLQAAWALASRQIRPDVVLDVQNGVPFLSALVTRRPVVALIHHVHREQWRVLFPPRAARLGWWVESRLGPFLYRRSRYVVVSEATKTELAGLDIDPTRIDIVHNGTPAMSPPTVARSETPRVIVLGRMVPHKQVEVVIEATAALRRSGTDLVLDIVGHGYHSDVLQRYAEACGVADAIVFHGFVDEATKSDLLARAWVNAVPSIKEGWALSVVEAAAHCTPSIAFAHTGGLTESIVDGVTGVLVDGDAARFTAELGALLGDDDRRARLGAAARAHAACYTWDDAVRGMTQVLDASLTGEVAAPQLV
jgi:glycosyltransferase involved in cell wall biosynthesis